MAKQVKKVETNALMMSNKLQNMIKKVLAGDKDAELKNTIARLAATMALAEFTIPVELDALVTKHAGEIPGSTVVQDPAWRGTVQAARGSNKKK